MRAVQLLHGAGYDARMPGDAVAKRAAWPDKAADAEARVPGEHGVDRTGAQRGGHLDLGGIEVLNLP